MKRLVKAVNTKPGVWHSVTPISDAHVDLAEFDLNSFKEFMNSRSRISNHSFIILGDFASWILPKDSKRYNSSVNNKSLSSRDDLVNGILDFQADIISRHNVDMISYGNHETSLLQHNSIDAIKLLCEKTGAINGGYCGYLTYRMYVGHGVSVDFTMLYHHGAWIGKASSGLPGLKSWAADFEGFDVCVAGHNHATAVDKRVRRRPSTKDDGQCFDRSVYYIFCGTHQQSYTDTLPKYEEIRGHSPHPIGSPLISWRVIDSHRSNARRYVEIAVTI